MFNPEDLNKILIHDSSKEKYRCPLGAVKTGSDVTFRLFCHGHSFDCVYLHVLRGADKEMYAMYPCTGGYEVTFNVKGEAIVLWYYFTANCGDTPVFYGRNYDYAGIGKVYYEIPPAFQLTVYENDFSVPEWMQGAVYYQIFPDRFCRGNAENMERGVKHSLDNGRHVVCHSSWDEKVKWQPDEGDEYYIPNDYFGGDIQGIIDNLPYFKDMGITALYINPIFEAHSNHRYNTGDYKKIDPFLGTEDDFKALIETAHTYGISVMLDGVFSHTGDDSIYFNKYGRYQSSGAYQSMESPFFPWYDFWEFPDKYRSWWGFTSLPEVNETNDSWKEYIISGGDSVIKHWLKLGADAFRLDVADELPDEIIFQMRDAVRSCGTEKGLLGEVWEDATTKTSYNNVRKYALGKGLDSVMNYPFRKAVLDFLIRRSDAYGLMSFLVSQSQNYPKEMYYSLMNLISSHDVERAHTILALGHDASDLSREQQALLAINDEQIAVGDTLMQLACALQFSVPGAPCIYYGDECSMDGMKDPFNRQPYSNRKSSVYDAIKLFSGFHRDYPALRTGGYVFHAVNEDCIAILRYSGEDAVLFAVNRGDFDIKFAVDISSDISCMNAGDKEALIANAKSINCLYGGHQDDCSILGKIITAAVSGRAVSVYHIC